MSRIFISYRRSDAAGHAGRLFDRVQARFGARFVFRDVDDIADGDAFPQVIQTALTTSNVVLVVIGPHWVNTLDGSGRRRLDNPQDWVRTETAMALKQEARVIPVLVAGAQMPRADDLPDDLKPLASLSARTIDDTDFDADVTRLLDSLEKFGKPVALTVRRLSRLALGVAGVGLLAVGGFFALSTTVPDVVGRTVDEARRLAADARLGIVKEDRLPSPRMRGIVLSQTPRPGRRMGNASLTLVVSERETVDLSKWVEIRNQETEGTGPGFAMATAMSASLAFQGRRKPLSPRYIYEKARALDPDLRRNEAGARIDYICTVATKFGAVTEDLWPYRPLERQVPAQINWPRLDQAAAQYKAQLVPVRSLNAVHEQLRSGRFVVAVVKGSETWMNADVPTTGRIPLVDNADPLSAHVVVIVAMDSMSDAIRFANSWGVGWGDKGFGTMSERVARQMLAMDQMWAVEVLRNGH